MLCGVWSGVLGRSIGFQGIPRYFRGDFWGVKGLQDVSKEVSEAFQRGSTRFPEILGCFRGFLWGQRRFGRLGVPQGFRGFQEV